MKQLFPVIILAVFVFGGCEKQFTEKEKDLPPQTINKVQEQTKSG
ncbi:MAG: hypothetical protein AB2L26_14425 [Ignavibacteria bacterium]